MTGEVRRAKGPVTRIESFFADGNDFEDALGEAEDAATRPGELDFVAGLRRSWNLYGMNAFMSQGQYDWLCRLSGWEP